MKAQNLDNAIGANGIRYVLAALAVNVSMLVLDVMICMF
jgi:hypothetical protein